METNEKKEEKTKRWRSPNYPSIYLGRAFDSIEILYRTHNIYLVAIEVIAKDWGLSAKSSSFAQHLAALSSYGLIDVEGVGESRKIKISDFAFRIISDNRPDSPDRALLVRDAALRPEIFRKIYNAYPSGLPADHNLEYELIHTYKFNPQTVREFISIFKKTINYAKVYESGIIGEEIKITEMPDMGMPDKIDLKMSRAKIYPDKIQLIENEREIANYPIGKGLKARILISGSSPITIEAIDKLIKLLDINKEDLPEVTIDENEDQIEH